MGIFEPQRQRLAALSLALAAGLWTAPPAATAPGAAPPALVPASTGGLEALDRALARLSCHRRLLVIAAHPDDEDTRLLTLVARGMGGEAAYLSLSRGEGGQNLIGSELGVGLGLLRSRELESARQIDGARQFFSRAYDFGFTRSLDETLGQWPKEVLLEDALRVVRRFKPQVLVTVFPPSAQAGHGQHWAAGVIAAEVFGLAAAPDALPQLLAEQLPPWRVDALYRTTFFDRPATTLALPLGVLEPFSGKSVFQISMASRSRHRSQDMGLLEPLGAADAQLAWVAGAGGREAKDVFSGVDIRLGAIAELLPAGELRERSATRLERVAELASTARHALAPAEVDRAVEPLREIVTLLSAIREELMADSGGAAQRQVAELVGEKLTIASEALANAAGVIADASADRETVVAGDRFKVSAVLWNAGSREVSAPKLALGGSAAWETMSLGPPPAQEGVFATGGTEEQVFELAVPADAPPTLPYFLTQPLAGALYDWSSVPAAVRGEPFEAPPLTVRFELTIAGAPVVLEREVVARRRDQAIGEVRRPLRVVPALEVSVEPALVVWPVDSKNEEKLRVELRSNVERPLAGRVEIAVPPGWPAPPAIEFNLDQPRAQREIELSLRAPAGLAAGRSSVAVRAVVAGERFERAVALLDYPHVRPTPMPVEARVTISASDIHLPQLRRLGYVRGASDRVPELLAAIGVPVEVLTPEQLVRGDLGGFDAILIGSRAYETEPALVEANGRLLEYVRAGGLAVVQYQQYQYTSGGFTPYPLDIRRPHDRITDEGAVVRVLEPEHPVFHHPNEIGAADWEGWVQERGLYFAGSWDDAYRPLLAMQDGEGLEQHGGLLVARLGAGTYVYTGLAFFRQLPAGVPGAYRLLVNLLALAEQTPASQNTEPAPKLGWLKLPGWLR